LDDNTDDSDLSSTNFVAKPRNNITTSSSSLPNRNPALISVSSRRTLPTSPTSPSSHSDEEDDVDELVAARPRYQTSVVPPVIPLSARALASAATSSAYRGN
jgi:hypothetical protein